VDVQRVVLTEPFGYREFLSLETQAAIVLTDSGGIQEETTALDVPCFTLRENTERPVTVTLGTNEIIGLEPEAILTIPDRPRKQRKQLPPKWEGHAGEEAAEAIESAL
jgi:UDP-N-acetylglucosamine 2-epimerase (non-hydrolysing)